MYPFLKNILVTLLTCTVSSLTMAEEKNQKFDLLALPERIVPSAFIESEEGGDLDDWPNEQIFKKGEFKLQDVPEDVKEDVRWWLAYLFKPEFVPKDILTYTRFLRKTWTATEDDPIDLRDYAWIRYKLGNGPIFQICQIPAIGKIAIKLPADLSRDLKTAAEAETLLKTALKTYFKEGGVVTKWHFGFPTGIIPELEGQQIDPANPPKRPIPASPQIGTFWFARPLAQFQDGVPWLEDLCLYTNGQVVIIRFTKQRPDMVSTRVPLWMYNWFEPEKRNKK